MSGIAVMYRPDGRPVDREMVGRMLSAITHRGPDGVNLWVKGAVALGHAMLRTTPESMHEMQPLVDVDADLCLTMDGRVDNRAELTKALEQRSFRPTAGTDAELVLRAYQLWGEESPKRILGDFAFAIWDGRRRELFCARDAMGVKPFYYYWDGQTLLCGSELQQILACALVAPEPNEEVIGVYLSGKIIDCNSTLYRRVFRLEPSHSMIVGPHGMRKRQYFDLNSSRSIRYRTDRDYGEHFLEIFQSAVLCRLRSHNGAVAAELSGGLDSSMVVGTSASLLRDGAAPESHFETFSMLFSDPIGDERDFIAEMTAMWGLRSNMVPAFVVDLAYCLNTLRRYRDFIGPPNHAMAIPMIAKAEERGFRVMLTGLGGDEWFAGSRAYLADLLLGLRLIKAVGYVRSHRRSSGNQEYRRLFRDGVWRPLIPPRWKPALRRLRGVSTVPLFINKAFARRTDLERRLDWETPCPPGVSFAQRDLYDSFKSASGLYFLELADRTYASHSIEVRHPFHDRRVIEFAFAIPEEQRRRDGYLRKVVVREAGRRLLPETIRQRRGKADFGVTFQTGLIRILKAIEERETFESFDVAARGWINPGAVRKAFAVSAESFRGLWPLWSILEIELWCREALGPSPA